MCKGVFGCGCGCMVGGWVVYVHPDMDISSL